MTHITSTFIQNTRPLNCVATTCHSNETDLTVMKHLQFDFFFKWNTCAYLYTNIETKFNVKLYKFKM